MSSHVLTEMEVQRHQGSQRLVLGNLHGIRYYENRPAGTLPTVIEAELRNVGSGPALKVQSSLLVNGTAYTGIGAGFGGRAVVLAHGGRQILGGRYELPPDQRGTHYSGNTLNVTLTVSYEDIYQWEFAAHHSFTADAGAGSQLGDVAALESLDVVRVVRVTDTATGHDTGGVHKVTP